MPRLSISTMSSSASAPVLRDASQPLMSRRESGDRYSDRKESAAAPSHSLTVRHPATSDHPSVS